MATTARIFAILLMVGVSNCMSVLVPAYFDPSSNAGAWATLATAASTLEGGVVAIANPASGPGQSGQSSYSQAFSQLQASSGRVIGYVYTSYGNRAASSVKADVDTWFSLYPSINGIFFDEAASVNGSQAYYRDLYAYVKTKDSSSLVVNNPGTNTLESYLFYNGMRVADVIVVFESNTGFLTWSAASWNLNYDDNNFCALAYNVPSSGYEDIVDHAADQTVGWIYVTNDTTPNPWDTLPSYFLDEIDYVSTV